MVQSAIRSEDGKPAGRRAAATSSARASEPLLPPYAMGCTVLTPSGILVARGRVAPRPAGLVAEAYAVRLSEIDPPGVLEAMVYANQPQIVLRAEDIPELHLQIDHITGSPDRREFFCVVGGGSS